MKYLRKVIILRATLAAMGVWQGASTPEARAAWSCPIAGTCPSLEAACQDIADFRGLPWYGRVRPEPGGAYMLCHVPILAGVYELTYWDPTWPSCAPGQVADLGMDTGCDGDKPKRECTECDKESNPTAGNPILVSTGNKHESKTDFATSGPKVLGFTRYYNSFHNDITALGMGWRHNYNRSLKPAGGSWTTPAWIDSFRPNGQVIRFTLTAGVYESPTDRDMQLTLVGSDWVFTEDGQTERYDGTGILQWIEDPDGYRQTLTYTSGLLTQVADSYLRTMTFTYKTNSFGYLETVTAPDGQVYKYERDDTSHRLKSILYPDDTPSDDTDNPKLVYEYEDGRFWFALTGITDERGHRYATFTYDSVRRATSSKHGTGNADKVTVAYDTAPNVNTVTNARGKQSNYLLSTVAGIPKVTDVQSLATANTPATTKPRTYNGDGYVNQITDAEANVTSRVRNARGLPTTVNQAVGDPKARTLTYSWHPTLRVQTQIVKPNLTVDLTYDTKGNLETRTETDTTTHTVPYATAGQTRVWTYTYTYDISIPSLLLKKEVDGPRPGTVDKTTYDYDSNGYLTKVTNALGHITDITAVDGMGRPTSVTDPNGVVTTMAYDLLGRLLTRTLDPGGAEAVTAYEYDIAGLVRKITQPNGAVLNYRYDDAQRLVEVSNVLGEKIVYTLDDLGNTTMEEVKSADGAIKRTVTREFDELGRLLKNIGAALQTTDYTYNNNNQIHTVSDPKNNVTTRANDGLRRLASVNDAALNDVIYTRDPADNLTGVTDQRTLATTYVHNGFGEVIRRDSPDTGVTDFWYDSAGNLIKKTDARSVTVDYAYDDLNRRTAKTFPGNTAENVTYTYDDIALGNKGKGRLTRIQDSSGSIDYVYDTHGNVATETRVIGIQSYTTAYAYDASGNLTEITYPSGRIVSYQRDSLGRVIAVTTRQNLAAPEMAIAAAIEYLPFGPIASVTYGNGHKTAYSHDLDYRLSGLVTTDGVTAVQDLTYGYDPASNITAITDALTAPQSQVFDYDPLHRLTDATGDYGDIDYVYDAVGNRSTRTVDLGTPETLGYDTASNRLLSVADGVGTRNLGYTANGNIATDSRDGGLGFEYSHDNRMTQVTDQAIPPNPIAGYVYNDLGQRVSKTIGSAVTHFQYGRSGVMIAETDAVGVVAREYIHLAGLPLAVLEGGGTPVAPTETILDNGDSGTASTGTWTTSTDWAGYYGADYLAVESGDGTGSYSWTPTIAATGAQQVWVRVPADAAEGSHATYTVTHAGGTSEVTLDQREAGGQWRMLGAFRMDPASGHGVSVSDKADVPPPVAGLGYVILDNTTPGYGYNGSWFTNVTPTAWLDHFRWAWNSSSLKFWWPASAIPEANQYRVYAMWPASYVSHLGVKFSIFDDFGVIPVIRRLRSSGGQWSPLGVFDLTPGPGSAVELTNNGTGGPGDLVYADALLLVPDPNAVYGVTEVYGDNRDANFFSAGTWAFLNLTGTHWAYNYDAHQDPHTAGTANAGWNATMLTDPGLYRVYAWWPVDSGQSAAVKYRINHTGGEAIVTVNQKLDGGRWVMLGEYDLAPGTGPLIEVRDDATAGTIAVDGVKLVRLHPTAPEADVVIDNADPSVIVTGTWTPFSGPSYVGGDILQAAAGTGDATVTWPFAPTEPGRYRVSARWSAHSNRASNAPYTIHHDDGVTVQRMNQEKDGGQWVPLGTYNFGAGGTNKVVLTNHANEYVIADAVKFEEVPRQAVRTVAADAARFTTNNAEAASVRYVHPDHLGSPQKMTDAAGAVVWTAAFTPFGRDAAVTGAATNNNRFPGQYYDLETSLNYNYWRDYDPTTGRYVQSDPIGLKAGLNTYAYVGGDPVAWIDQRGLISIELALYYYFTNNDPNKIINVTFGEVDVGLQPRDFDLAP